MKIFKNTRGEWDWSKLIFPILAIIVVPLIGLIYNNMARAIEKKADKDTTVMSISTLKEKVSLKVNNETLMLLLQQQKIQQEFMQEQIRDQKTVGTKTLETLQILNVQMKLIEQQLKKE